MPPLLARAVAAGLFKALGLAPVKPTVALALGSEAELKVTMADAVRRHGLPASPIAGRIRLPAEAVDAAVQPSFEFEAVTVDG